MRHSSAAENINNNLELVNIIQTMDQTVMYLGKFVVVIKVTTYIQ